MFATLHAIFQQASKTAAGKLLENESHFVQKILFSIKIVFKNVKFET